MNRHQLTSIGVALACFLAVGVAATTLSSTLSSDPDEAVDVDYQYLPIESADVADLQQKINSKKRDADLAADHEAEGGGEGPEGRGSGPQTPQPDERTPEPRDVNPSAGDADDPGNMPGQNEAGAGPAPGNGSRVMPGDGTDGGSGASNSETAAAETESSSGGVLPVLVGLLFVALLGAVAYRYRDRLLGLFGSEDDSTTAPDADDGWEPSPPPDANVVFAAWDALLRNLDTENVRARTTGECANVAAAAGMDPDAVRTLTRTFEEVRYGQRPVTDDRRQRVSQVCQRLQLDPSEVRT